MAEILAQRTPVIFRGESHHGRGYIDGTLTEPDGSLTYRIWDGDGFRHITADRVMPLRNRRRGQ